jgi:lysylphosphatidylglycerol synthase-like protein
MTPPRVDAPAVTRKRWYLAAAALGGVALFAWTVASVGPRELLAQLRSLAPVLSLILILAGIRFWLQAAGWRLAMPSAQRPTWREVFAAVVAGEAAGYFAWGPVSREPMKAWLVGHRVPERTALGAAVVERFFYSIAAAALIVSAIALAAVRYHFVGKFLVGLLIAAIVAVVARRYWTKFTRERHSRSTTIGLVGFAMAQEVSNLVEAYLVLAWLGASPTIASVVVLEGISRLMNGAGQFIPGKLGITEAATTALAEGLRLGGAHGLSLALARRARSLLWGAGGVGFVAYRAARQAPPAA